MSPCSEMRWTSCSSKSAVLMEETRSRKVAYRTLTSGEERLVLLTACQFISRFYLITGIRSLSPLLGVKIIRLIDRTDLFKINNLV